MTVLTFNGNTVHTSGTLPTIGSQAPDFTVTKTDLSEISLKHCLGRKIILNIFPSLDTKTCASAMQKFNQIAQDNKNILILCISADLPFAQSRFCAAQHLTNVQPVSVFRHPQFGLDYGVLMTDGIISGLLCRAVLALNEHGKIIYTQQVSELTEEPNYDALIQAITTNQV